MVNNIFFEKNYKKVYLLSYNREKKTLILKMIFMIDFNNLKMNEISLNRIMSGLLK